MAKAIWLWEPNADPQLQADTSLGAELRSEKGVQASQAVVKRNQGPHFTMNEVASNTTDDGSNWCSDHRDSHGW